MTETPPTIDPTVCPHCHRQYSLPTIWPTVAMLAIVCGFILGLILVLRLT